MRTKANPGDYDCYANAKPDEAMARGASHMSAEHPINAVRDGNVWRIVAADGRRYYFDREVGKGWFAEQLFFTEPNGWDQLTGYTESEAVMLLDALRREFDVRAHYKRLQDAVKTIWEFGEP